MRRALMTLIEKKLRRACFRYLGGVISNKNGSIADEIYRLEKLYRADYYVRNN